MNGARFLICSSCSTALCAQLLAETMNGAHQALLGQCAAFVGAQLLAETMNGAHKPSNCLASEKLACSTPCGDDERCTRRLNWQRLLSSCAQLLAETMNGAPSMRVALCLCLLGAQLLAETMNGAPGRICPAAKRAHKCSTPCGDDERCTRSAQCVHPVLRCAQLLAETMNGARPIDLSGGAAYF